MLGPSLIQYSLRLFQAVKSTRKTSAQPTPLCVSERHTFALLSSDAASTAKPSRKSVYPSHPIRQSIPSPSSILS